MVHEDPGPRAAPRGRFQFAMTSKASLFVLSLLGLYLVSSSAAAYPGSDCDDQQEYCGDLGYGEVRCVDLSGGMLGDGPFVCSQLCTDGIGYDSFDCEISPDKLVTEGSDNLTGTNNWPCRGELDCPCEVTGAYQTCGGVIWSMMVDDSDNLYFWTARGRLHSVDKDGAFRWRFELCAPEPDYLPTTQSCGRAFRR